MTMVQRATVLLVMALGLSFGHAPCCIVPGACSEARVTHVETSTCCPRCAERRRAVPSAPDRTIAMCDCPSVAGLFEMVEPIEFTPVALPELAAASEPAPLRRRAAPTPASLHAPPRCARNLPLLL